MAGARSFLNTITQGIRSFTARINAARTGMAARDGTAARINAVRQTPSPDTQMQTNSSIPAPANSLNRTQATSSLISSVQQAGLSATADPSSLSHRAALSSLQPPEPQPTPDNKRIAMLSENLVATAQIAAADKVLLSPVLKGKPTFSAYAEAMRKINTSEKLAICALDKYVAALNGTAESDNTRADKYWQSTASILSSYPYDKAEQQKADFVAKILQHSHTCPLPAKELKQQFLHITQDVHFKDKLAIYIELDSLAEKMETASELDSAENELNNIMNNAPLMVAISTHQVFSFKLREVIGSVIAQKLINENLLQGISKSHKEKSDLSHQVNQHMHSYFAHSNFTHRSVHEIYKLTKAELEKTH